MPRFAILCCRVSMNSRFRIQKGLFICKFSSGYEVCRLVMQ
uniref:Uncharacterized protein n=1 Tax=Anguilla anguilla TaxID=7936 RepID=A0A0E9TSL3_ANGAN